MRWEGREGSISSGSQVWHPRSGITIISWDLSEISSLSFIPDLKIRYSGDGAPGGLTGPTGDSCALKWPKLRKIKLQAFGIGQWDTEDLTRMVGGRREEMGLVRLSNLIGCLSDKETNDVAALSLVAESGWCLSAGPWNTGY